MTDVKATIHVEFSDNRSAEASVHVENVSVPQVWIAIEVLRHFAEDLYRSQQGPKPGPALRVAHSLDHLPKLKDRQ